MSIKIVCRKKIARTCKNKKLNKIIITFMMSQQKIYKSMTYYGPQIPSHPYRILIGNNTNSLQGSRKTRIEKNECIKENECIIQS